jgi:hypothetical protein
MPSDGGSKPEDFSLVSFAEILIPLLDAVAPKTVVEVGADHGDFTSVLLEWAGPAGSSVASVETEPPPDLLELAERNPELRLVRTPSPEALTELLPADAVILDGDHNHHTLSAELRTIDERCDSVPLVVMHDLGWPHARRDTYYVPERVPDEHRQPLARDAMVAPGEPGIASAGILFPWAAAREGGERNGVLTAVEDFIGERRDLRLAVVPAFFGLGVLWSTNAPWAAEVERVLAPWDASPMLARLEELRLAQIVDAVRLDRQQEVLRALLGSRAFRLAERIARLRGGAETPISRERVRRALEE